MTPAPSYDGSYPNDTSFGTLTFGGAYVRANVDSGYLRWYQIGVPSWPASGDLSIFLTIQGFPVVGGSAMMAIYNGQYPNGAAAQRIPSNLTAPIATTPFGFLGTTLIISLNQTSANWLGPSGFYFIAVIGGSPNGASYLLSWNPITPSASATATGTRTSAATVSQTPSPSFTPTSTARSEERRVGKECV
jgi:hypothetical protein